MQKIIMIQQADEISDSHLYALVSVFADSAIVEKLFVFYAFVFVCNFSTNFLYILVACIASIGKAKFSVFIRLEQYRAYHFPQKIFRCIV